MQMVTMLMLSSFITFIVTVTFTDFITDFQFYIALSFITQVHLVWIVLKLSRRNG